MPRIVGFPACVHDGFVVIREFEKKVNKFYLYHFIDFISTKLAGSGQPGTQKNLNTTIVNGIEIPVISIKEQQRIASTFTAADNEIEQLENQLDKLQEQKKGLMQQLLTGQIRVKISN